MKTGGVSESQFYMWRTLFAMVHVDNVVAPQEVRFMAEALEDVPFSATQRSVLNEDIKYPRDVEEMFKGITEAKDQAQFFEYARTLVYIDGDFGAEERAAMTRLQELRLKDTDLSALVGHVELELEDEPGRHEQDIAPGTAASREYGSVLSALQSLFSRRRSVS